ncbi:GH25 family lysozyme [Palleronia abyssalis]|uniref:Lysozyme M1 n=1 Tax=Palleronia abyssalis TaxID=1501240 RepID=A0A2R8BYY9_9RHOB|nr:GH25 family lysozyme [Palleronia abyssalis]SPJ25352.1 Lysozyme M1 [Palleronia abyssalis]
MFRRSFLLFSLAACARPAAPPIIGRAIPPDFGDVDPTDWGGRGPDRFPVHGIDLSRWQGDIDWTAARAAGVNFAWIKATEGGDRIDPMFAAHHDAAQRAGVAVGAYHFFYWCGPPETQARWFIQNVPRRAGDLPPVLDLEWTPFSPTCTVRPPAAEVRDRATRFMSILARHYGQMPLIYTTREFYPENQIARLGAETWLRSTARPVEDAYPGAPWRVWQYTATGRVPGISGNVDLNAFNGSEGAWHAWRAARSIL